LNAVAEIRPSPLAGTNWYDGNPARLRRQVQGYLEGARLPLLPGEVVALISPHAGLRYSGRTAGHAFAAVRGRNPSLVVVVSPMHHSFPGSLITTAHRAYATPLGSLWVDEEALGALEEKLAQSGLDLARAVNDREHSLEIELPFLQVALKGEFALLPLMVRSQSPQVALQLGKALAQVLRGRDALLVASTDLSHFYPERMARELDTEMLRRMRGFSPDDLFAAELSGKGYACGVAAAAAVLWAARDLGADCVEILHYSTSGEETGDFTSVVGYGAAAALRIT
jgi:hypothetical protein